ncbi:MAG: DNA polymerase III subunit beta [bacterium]|nr:DNA polymerase III subunit beta [bacterium]
MELTIGKNELTKALSFVQTIVQKKTTMPILANALMSIDGEFLTISATDLEITATAKAKGKVTKPGSTTVNAKILYDVVKELPDGDVSLKVTEGERLEVVCGKSKTRIIGASAEEYPGLPGQAISCKSRIPSKQLSEMIAKTIYSVSMDETRFNLNGVNFEIVEVDNQKLFRMVATDGHRLAMITRPASSLSFSGTVLVPRKGLLEIRKLIDENNPEEIGIGLEEGFLVIEGDSIKLSMRLIDGEFPDYRQVVPKQKGTKAVFNSVDLAMALRRVSLMVTDKAKGSRLDFSDGLLRISSSSPELGDASEEIQVDYKGPPLSVGFNAKYVLDTLTAVDEAKRFTIELHGELGPGKLYPESDESCVAIVMPMRLN